MAPAFTTWSQFLDMSGYAPYVWLTVSITLLSLLALVAHTCWQRKVILRTIRSRIEREQRLQQRSQEQSNSREQR